MSCYLCDNVEFATNQEVEPTAGSDTIKRNRVKEQGERTRRRKKGDEHKDECLD